jgi:hypothetical protein
MSLIEARKRARLLWVTRLECILRIVGGVRGIIFCIATKVITVADLSRDKGHESNEVGRKGGGGWSTQQSRPAGKLLILCLQRPII